MPKPDEPIKEKTIQDVVDDLNVYPIDAFEFVQRGLSYTVRKIHGQRKDPKDCHHVSGPELCHGLRELALVQWGLLARTVLERWHITTTYDFGRIIFALVDSGMMQKTDEDDIEDFRNVYDFAKAFESDYRIESKV